MSFRFNDYTIVCIKLIHTGPPSRIYYFRKWATLRILLSMNSLIALIKGYKGRVKFKE